MKAGFLGNIDDFLFRRTDHGGRLLYPIAVQVLQRRHTDMISKKTGKILLIQLTNRR